MAGIIGGPEKDRFGERRRTSLLGGGVLGDCLGALRHGMLGQLPGEKEPDGGLDLPRGDGGSLVVVGQAGSLCRDALEDVIDKAVHDGHGLARDPSVGVDLLEDLVDVDPVRLLPALLPFLVSFADVLLGLARLLGCLSRRFRCHDSDWPQR